MTNDPDYIPALRFHWLTRFYDPLVRATTKEAKIKSMLVEQARIDTGRLLDVGCGTATLAVQLKRSCPDAEIIGLDGDPGILRLAREKVEKAGVAVQLVEGMAYAPPFEPGSFDRIVSTLMFHHLRREDKRRSLRKLRELLKPGGELHIADWGRAQNLLMRFAFLGIQFLDGFATTTDNVQGKLIPMMEEAGFSDVSETHREMTLLGTMSLYRAVAP